MCASQSKPSSPRPRLPTKLSKFITYIFDTTAEASPLSHSMAGRTLCSVNGCLLVTAESPPQRGTLYVTSSAVLFVRDLDPHSQAVIVHHGDVTPRSWSIESIEGVKRRRYLLRNVAMELFLVQKVRVDHEKIHLCKSMCTYIAIGLICISYTRISIHRFTQ